MIRATSALVPPMSSVITLGWPASRATQAAPITPDAVPDRTMLTQARLPSSARMMPPLDLVISGSAVTPRLSRPSISFSR